MFPPLIFINLKRRTDRYKSCMEQFDKQRIPSDQIYRFVGKDARSYEVSQEEWDMFQHADFIRDSSIRKPIVCNFMCHYDIWNYMVERKLPYLLVLQDDIVLRNEFMYHVNNVISYLPDDAELVNLGFPEQMPLYNINEPHTKECFTEEVTPYVSRIHPSVNPCSLCYLLTLEGAQNLIEHADRFGVHRAGDGWMNDYCKSKNIFYGSSIILATHNSTFGSDIFPR